MNPGGRNGRTAALTLDVGLSEPVVFEVGASSITLTAPSWPQLAGLTGVAATNGPVPLLLALSARGLHLLPEERDAPFAGVVAKDFATELAMCNDLATLA